MLNIRPFQIVLIGIFVFFALGGLIFLAVFKKSGSDTVKAYGDSVIIWGTLDRDVFSEIKVKITGTDKEFFAVEYVEKDLRTFDDELLNAIAENRSPDLIVLPHSSLVNYRAKLAPIPFETLPERVFKDTYIDGAEIFMRSDAVYGIPFAVDPLVMYWNRDIFSSSGLAAPPTTWESLAFNSTPAITRKDPEHNITRSAIAFGEYNNIKHAKKILSMLFFQSGSTIVDESGTSYTITLNKGVENSLQPADAVLSFYTQFALPSSQNYSWNRALPNDRLEFLSGDLGMYFGLGSEMPLIQKENPNLNFDVARVPQGASAATLRDYGEFYAFAIPRASGNPQGAFRAAQTLGSESISANLALLLNMAPVYRKTIAEGTNDAYRHILYQSALISRGWLDPNPEKSENVFRLMIEDVTSGRKRNSEVIQDAIDRLRLLFK